MPDTTAPETSPLRPDQSTSTKLDPTVIAVVVTLILSVGVGALVPYKFMGLPTHAIIVHAATVFIPLLAIAAIVLLWTEKWRARSTTGLAFAAIAVSAIAGAASQSGEKLQQNLGERSDLIQQHAEWGDRLHWIVLILTVILVGHFFMKRLNLETPLLTLGFKLLVTIVGVVTLAAVTYVGHLGAEAVWKDRLNKADKAGFSNVPGLVQGNNVER